MITTTGTVDLRVHRVTVDLADLALVFDSLRSPDEPWTPEHTAAAERLADVVDRERDERIRHGLMDRPAGHRGHLRAVAP